MSKIRAAILSTGVILTLGVTTGCDDFLLIEEDQTPGPPAEAETTRDPIEPDAYHDMLDSLRVQDWYAGRDYDRDDYGPAWHDVDGTGCDTRNETLLRDLDDVALSDDGCTVLTGTLVDPYTSQTIDFERGEGSIAVQIDHVVSLHDAWGKGADEWDQELRVEFANDPINLLAVDGPANGSKSNHTIDLWVPDNDMYWCDLAQIMVEVKFNYDLAVDQEEGDELLWMLDNACHPDWDGYDGWDED